MAGRRASDRQGTKGLLASTQVRWPRTKQLTELSGDAVPRGMLQCTQIYYTLNIVFTIYRPGLSRVSITLSGDLLILHYHGLGIDPFII
jgi:hypothetical protein